MMECHAIGRGSSAVVDEGNSLLYFLLIFLCFLLFFLFFNFS